MQLKDGCAKTSGKTEQIITDPKQPGTQFEGVMLCLEGSASAQSPCVSNLGVFVQPMLSFDQHVKSITRTAFFHLRNIAIIRPTLSAVDAEALTHALISPRLVYCNVLFSGSPNSIAKSLQLVQNGIARLLNCVLPSFHWLPIN